MHNDTVILTTEHSSGLPAIMYLMGFLNKNVHSILLRPNAMGNSHVVVLSSWNSYNLLIVECCNCYGDSQLQFFSWEWGRSQSVTGNVIVLWAAKESDLDILCLFCDRQYHGF
ncbi:hypothetical protein CEXT_397921 [Caerostris extrusa]|uniref:Uncharacterized protein n=1 Tax=Caerostris extrusa TaxID=172846 RepID=A0AAV4S3Y1_CAEEX|nr:hypothetical protein CEXT_397921 [Caerostris extrusa]